MHRDHDKDRREYTGPERRKNERRKMVLQADDIGVIKNVVTKIVDDKMVGHCRYEIEPKDLGELLAFVRVFQQGAMDIKGATRSLILKKILPRIIIGTVVTVLMDWLGILRPFLNAAMKVMRGVG
jgi:hypothetical protein